MIAVEASTASAAEYDEYPIIAGFESADEMSGNWMYILQYSFDHLLSPTTTFTRSGRQREGHDN